MAFKTFAANATLTAADVNDYLMEQAVIACTSGTRPGSPNEGMTIYETDTNAIKCYSGSAWETVLYPIDGWITYTPTVSQDTTKDPRIDVGTHTNTYVKYRRVGRSVRVHASISITAAGSAAAGNLVEVSLPISAATSGLNVGTGYIYDASANLTHKGLAYLPHVDRVAFVGTASTSPSGLGIADFTAALAASDAVVFSIEYETAS